MCLSLGLQNCMQSRTMFLTPHSPCFELLQRFEAIFNVAKYDSEYQADRRDRPLLQALLMTNKKNERPSLFLEKRAIEEKSSQRVILNQSALQFAVIITERCTYLVTNICRWNESDV